MKNIKNVILKLMLVQVLVLLLIIPHQGMAAESCLKLELKTGPYAVGFKYINHYDRSRTFYSQFNDIGDLVSEKARPIRISAWYPANPGKAKNTKPMPYKEYIYLLAFEKESPQLTEALKKQSIEAFHSFLSTPDHKRAEQDVITNVVRDAEPAAGSFPLMVYGPSINSFSFENTELFAYLASHGYIVVSSPCFGRTSREMTQDLMGVESQARDMEFLLGYMQDFPYVDRSKTALIGFSWGGLSIVLTALRDTRVNAFVCLDPTIKSPQGYKLIKESIFYNPDHITMPTLFMISKDYPEELLKKYGVKKPEKKLEFYDQLKYSSSYLIQFHHLIHHNFSSAFIRFTTRRPDRAESSQEEINHSYALMCKVVRSFLDGHLKGSPRALAFMKNSPRGNDIAEGIISKESKAGTKPFPRVSEFIHKVKKAGFDKISQVYAEIKKSYPGFTLNDDRFSEAGWEFMVKDKLDPALAIFKLGIELNPKYHWYFYGQGLCYQKKGKKAAAIKAFEKVLELNPRFDRAREKIKKLKEN